MHSVIFFFFLKKNQKLTQLSHLAKIIGKELGVAREVPREFSL